MDLAPIVLFAYKRLGQLQQSVDSLRNCDLASESELYIYSDGPKSANECAAIQEIRNYLKSINGFKSVTIVEKTSNIGLAQNIIQGVTEIINKRGRVIVLEDDLILGKYFLSYMNTALDMYKNDPKVWHISGWNYPFEKSDMNESSYFIRSMNCWGWGTWSDRWSHFNNDCSLVKSSFNPQQIHEFNLKGSYNFFSQIEDNFSGKKKTWAIFWYATIFHNHGLCLNPTHSLVQNIGLDGLGENCQAEDYYNNTEIDDAILLKRLPIVESEMALKKLHEFYNFSFIMRLKTKVKKILTFVQNKVR